MCKTYVFVPRRFFGQVTIVNENVFSMCSPG